MKNVLILHPNVEVAQDSSLKPFLEHNFDISYCNFADVLRERDLHLSVANPNSFVDGVSKAAWYYEGLQWIKENDVVSDLILDRFSSPDKPETNGSLSQIIKCENKLFNEYNLERLCKDKFPSRDYFDKHFINTLKINGEVNTEEIKKIISSDNPDFDYNILIFKPRYGSGGRGFYTDPKLGLESLPPKELKEYVVQPFLETKKGIAELDVKNRHDLRLVVINGDIKYVEARVLDPKSKIEVFYPKSEGTITSFVEPSQVPQRFVNVMRDIDQSLGYDFKQRVYSIDLAQGQSETPYIFELNTRFDITWTRYSPKEFIEGRKNLQSILADEFVRRLA